MMYSENKCCVLEGGEEVLFSKGIWSVLKCVDYLQSLKCLICA